MYDAPISSRSFSNSFPPAPPRIAAIASKASTSSEVASGPRAKTAPRRCDSPWPRVIASSSSSSSWLARTIVRRASFAPSARASSRLARLHATRGAPRLRGHECSRWPGPDASALRDEVRRVPSQSGPPDRVPHAPRGPSDPVAVTLAIFARRGAARAGIVTARQPSPNRGPRSADKRCKRSRVSAMEHLGNLVLLAFIVPQLLSKMGGDQGAPGQRGSAVEKQLQSIPFRWRRDFGIPGDEVGRRREDPTTPVLGFLHQAERLHHRGRAIGQNQNTAP
jgi:hypothetical protein